jgi:hypothetical protein
MCNRPKRNADDFDQARAAAIAKLRKLAPDLPSPTFGDALSMLCHCGERLNEDCKCDAATTEQVEAISENLRGATEH